MEFIVPLHVAVICIMFALLRQCRRTVCKLVMRSEDTEYHNLLAHNTVYSHCRIKRLRILTAFHDVTSAINYTVS